MSIPITTDIFAVRPGFRPGVLWTYTLVATGEPFEFAPPVFEMDGRAITADSYTLRPDGQARTLPNGASEHRYRGTIAGEPGLTLAVVWQVAPDNPIVRFRYELGDAAGRRLTKTGGEDALTYLQTSFSVPPSVTEVRLAEFNEMVHSYCLSERMVEGAQFEAGLSVMGPILVGTHRGPRKRALLLAYEHGSQSPDSFLCYQLAHDDHSRRVSLQAVKGSYYDGQPADGYATPWLHAGAVAGTEDDMARAYRDFLLRYVTQNAASREPYIFYNTWNF